MKTTLISLRIIILLTSLLVVQPVIAATVVWSGADTNAGNYNWSDNVNWSGGVPAPANGIFFDDAAAVTSVASVNNIVDFSTNVLSLWYGNTNNYHTTLINPGVTLTVSNNAAVNLLVVGTLTDNGASQIVDATITGSGGTLSVIGTNAGSTMLVQQGTETTTGSHIAILDLSGLDTFSLTAGRLSVGGIPLSGNTSPNASNVLSGQLNLAATNLIQLNGTTSPQLVVGDAISNPNTLVNLLQLGQTNALYVDTMTIGRGKQAGTLNFNPADSGNNPALYLRGRTATRVATLAIGDNGAQTGTSSSSTGIMDLSLGTVDAQVNTCILGRGQLNATSTGGASGTLTLNAGIFNVNTLNAGVVNTNNANYNVTGTVNVNGTATLVVNANLALGLNPNTNSASAKTATGTLTINGGTVYANAITPSSAIASGVVSTINVTGGTLCITNTAGTPVLPLSALNLSGASLHLNASPAVTNIVAASVTGDAVITIDSIGYPGGTINCPLISYSGADPYSSLSYTLPAGYTGTLVDNNTSNRIDLQITAGPITPILGSVLWGGGANNNWDTTSANWTNGSFTTVYGDTDLVTFNDLGQTGNVNLASSILPGSVTVSNSAVNYAITGAGSIGGPGGLTKSGTGTLTLGTFNSYAGSTVINAGNVTTTVAGALPATTTVNFSAATNATLNLQGTAQTLAGMTFGTANSNNVVPITITGTAGSALTVSPATLTVAPASSSNYLTLNLSGLSSFTYTNASGTLAVNSGTPQAAPAGQTIFNLAGGTNSITAGTLGVGNNATSSGIANSTLNLGTNNTLNVGAINFGSGRADGTIQFASGIGNGTLKLAGVTGGSSTASLSLGSHDSYQASDKPVDMFDTTAGTLNAQFGNMNIGILAPTANSTNRGINMTCSFKMGAGTLTASNLTMGIMNNVANVTNYTATITTLFSITNGGTASITNLTLLNNNLTNTAGGNDHLTNNATVSLTDGATLNLTTIQLGNALSPATTATVLLWGDGTVGNIPGGNLTVNGVSVVLAGTATMHNFNISPGQSGLINSWITGTGTLTDAGTGALTLAGNNSFTGSLIMAGTNTLTLTKTNTYTGNTLINSGTLLLGANGSISNSSTITVASNAVFDVSALGGGWALNSGQTLSGAGSVNGGVTVLAGAQVVPGNISGAGTLTFSNNLALGNTATAVTHSSFTIAAGGRISAATLAVSGTNIINILDASLTVGTNTLITYGGGSIGGSSGFGGFLLGTLPSGVTAQLLNTGSAMKLAVTSVFTVNTNSPVLTNFVSGSALNLSWPADHLGWRLQMQTNSLNVGLGGNWFTWPNSTNVTAVSIPLNPANPTVFLRLIYP